MSPTIGLRSDKTDFRRPARRAAIEAYADRLGQLDIEYLMRSRRNGPAQHRTSEIGAPFSEGTHDASKFGPRQCMLDVHLSTVPR
jgi:hypothetical protein